MMSLENKIIDDMKNAMKEKNALKLETIRNIKSQIKYYQVDKKLDKVTDDDVITVINKLAKQRKDSLNQFTIAGRNDLADKEALELKILEEYLPKQLSESEIETIVKESIKETGINDKKQLGLLMKDIMPKLKGKADGKIVNQIVSKILN